MAVSVCSSNGVTTNTVALDAQAPQIIFGPGVVFRQTDLAKQHLGVSIMKTILSALIALSALTAVAASANAFDAKSFYEELDRSRT